MKRIQIILLFVLIAFVGVAQEKLSLADAIAKALENNYDIVLVQQRQQVAEINNNWGTAGRYPYLGLSLGSDNSINENENEDFSRSRYSAGLNLNWTLFDGYSVRINKQRFAELEEMSKQNTAILVEGTIQSVVLAYYAVLLEKERIHVVRELMNLSEARFLKVEDRKEFGSAVTFDVLQAKNAYLSDKTNFLSQEVAYKNALRDLKFLMAVEDSELFELIADFEAKPVDYVLAELHQQLALNNKALRNQYINQSLMENAVAAAKSSYFPSLSLAAGAGFNKTGTDFELRGKSWEDAANMYGNLTLSYNLFSGGNRKRAVQIAIIDEESSLVKIDQMQHDLGNKLNNIYEYYLVRKELLSVADENMEAANLNLQIAQEKFDAGSINSFNFRDVQLIYLNAAQQKLQAIYNFIDTHSSLLRMTGTIIQEFE